MPSSIKDKAPSRDVTDIGPGDYVKIGSRFEKVTSNSAHGAEQLPRNWTIRTEGGGTYGMYDIARYAKAEDVE